MSSRRSYSLTRCRGAALAVILGCLFFPHILSPAVESQSPPQDNTRTITADDFLKHRPDKTVRPGQRRSKLNPTAGNRRYRLSTETSEGAAARFRIASASQLGLTMWRMHPLISHDPAVRSRAWIAERAEADTRFHPGDYVRLSIESPRAGYLYVVDRDWFADDRLGESRLIFPIHGDDNRLRAGRVITLPAEDQIPFQAKPNPNQAGEILTIIVSSSPITLPLSNEPMLISTARLSEWQRLWAAATERFEMDGGAGQERTRIEEQASLRSKARQLTRDDPAPQTIFLISPSSNDAFLFQVKLFYAE